MESKLNGNSIPDLFDNCGLFLLHMVFWIKQCFAELILLVMYGQEIGLERMD